MARIRTIKPEFPQSESMGRISRDARLLFLELWTICDDSGRARGDSRMLARTLYPYDDGEDGHIKTTRADVEAWLGELEAVECIVRYRVDGDTYLQICNWLKHQKIDKPSASKIPAPDEDSRILASPRECSSLDQGRDQGKDQGEEGKKNASSSAAADSSPDVPRVTTVLPEIQFVLEIPTNTGKPWGITAEMIAEWRNTFPGLDVEAELRKARQWCLDNQARRKTASGMRKFLGNWLSRSNDNPRSRPPAVGGGVSRQHGLEVRNRAVAEQFGQSDEPEDLPHAA